jgi:hypothetical protein
MRKTTLFAVAAALIATGFGVWATAPTNARVSPSIGQGIEPFKLMMNAKELPSVEFVDYTFVFRWTAIEAWPTPWWIVPGVANGAGSFPLPDIPKCPCTCPRQSWSAAALRMASKLSDCSPIAAMLNPMLKTMASEIGGLPS